MSKTDRIRREGKGDGFDAYYYSFEPTGCEPIDNILKAVAGAGASQHNTDAWVDDGYDGEASPAECIQTVANESALEVGKLFENGAHWMLKTISRHVEVSPSVLDAVTSAWQGWLRRENASLNKKEKGE